MISAPSRLLVVDDDRDFGDSLREVLGLSGYEVEVARSGEEAIRRCRRDEFDLVLMDVRMPGKDGMQSFVEIRARDPDFRVILMTADPGTELQDRALSAGARAVVGKPLAPESLVDLIEMHRQRRLVLLVDDDEDFTVSTAALLELAGYAATVAADGESALERVAELHPNAVLLDLRLPGISGLDVLLELRRRHLQAPTVVVSAWLDAEFPAIRGLSDESVTAVLGKPFPPDDLLSVLAGISRAAHLARHH